MESEQTSNMLLLTAADIASWSSSKSNNSMCRAVLPALQRGAVWKAQQVEVLWDSLLRGFPVGAFLLTQYNKGERGEKKFTHSYSKGTSKQINPTHYLLDGQQRSNSIALGYFDPWTEEIANPQAVLWIDLAPRNMNDERIFAFRLLTRSHPWGYRHSDPLKPLEIKNRREAFSAYQKANSDCGGVSFEPGQIPLTHSWPWDAVAPIPFSFLLEAFIKNEDYVWETVLQLLANRLPYWKKCKKLRTIQDVRWRTNVKNSLASPTSAMENLIDGISHILGKNKQYPLYKIPALIIRPDITEPSMLHSKATNTEDGLIKDPVETLFIRVNSAGTQLKGEELNFSILKSIWPDAQKVVDELSTGLLPSSRLVALISRLILADGADKPPMVPDTARFRRLVHGRDLQCEKFEELIKRHLKSGRVKKILDNARSLLSITGELSDHRLPSFLTTGLARKSPDVFFLFLAWLDRMEQAGLDPLKMKTNEQRMVVGSVTALGWFAKDIESCLSVLWGRLISLEQKGKLGTFFSKGALKQCLNLTTQGAIRIIPLVPPEILQKAVDKSRPPKKGTSAKWKSWEWYPDFSGKLSDDSLESWYAVKLKSSQLEKRNAWTAFIDELSNKQELILYAQREWLSKKWFPRYDIENVDQLEDTDRPWDIDHIHPQIYHHGLKDYKPPQVIRDWHKTIGNLRAWPFELNRADGEDSPYKKLGVKVAITEVEKIYQLNDYLEIQAASFINKDNWKHWEKSTPEKKSTFERFPKNYLGKPDKYGDCRIQLITAISNRMVSLYKHWYDSLLINELF